MSPDDSALAEQYNAEVVRRLTAEAELLALKNQVESAVRLIEPDHITPQGARLIRRVLTNAEEDT